MTRRSFLTTLLALVGVKPSAAAALATDDVTLDWYRDPNVGTVIDGWLIGENTLAVGDRIVLRGLRDLGPMTIIGE